MNFSGNIIDEISERVSGSRSDLISFVAGVPPDDAYPRELARVLSCGSRSFSPARRRLGYPDVLGDADLRAAIAALEEGWGIDQTDRETVVTNGAQQAIDLSVRLFMRPGDRVLVARGTYPGAIRSFRLYNVDVVELDCDQHGIEVNERLERELAAGARAVYVVSDFANPTGCVMPAARRADIAGMCCRHGAWLLEDVAYRSIDFDGNALPPIAATHDTSAADRVVVIGSFSKTIAPGLRLGWMSVPSSKVDDLRLLRQGTDGGLSALTHAAVSQFLRGSYGRHLDRLRTLYRYRRDRAYSAVRRYLPDVKCNLPGGGFFLWLELSPGVEAIRVFEEAFECERVAVVPGGGFFLDPADGRNFVRLAFCSVDIAAIDVGIARLGAAYARVIDSRVAH